ncbi:winged helix-turn-helix domain-containing protein [Natronomonas sp.]|uniref:winged helix-turn-helix domain-containing protein n=1 Tax=Natronomonas sp. TaxID=2184060 RepID=UPI002FC3DD13
MNDDRTVAVEYQPPGEAFGLLSNDLRVEIVRTLGEAGEPMSFSAIRGAVGAEDSGQFNYHLRKLVDHFVTHGDEGYTLSMAGDRVYGAILSGAYTANASIAPFEFEGPCPLCGHDTLNAEYEDENAKLSCPDCSEWHNEFPFPPGSLDQFARADLPAAFDRWMHATVTKFFQGFCENCGGRIDGALERSSENDHVPVRALFECGRCGDELRCSPMLPVLFHPTAVSFLETHGVDVLHDPSWRYYGVDDDVSVEMAGDDPLTARLSITVDGAELTATVGPDVEIEKISAN